MLEFGAPADAIRLIAELQFDPARSLIEIGERIGAGKIAHDAMRPRVIDREETPGERTIAIDPRPAPHIFRLVRLDRPRDILTSARPQGVLHRGNASLTLLRVNDRRL